MACASVGTAAGDSDKGYYQGSALGREILAEEGRGEQPL